MECSKETQEVMNSMRILDLFCGGGGAALGMSKYGKITGVDIMPQPDYPYNFIIGDALALSPEFLDQFDFIWLSPPCQAYSCASAVARSQGAQYPDLVAPARELVIKSGKPYCMENVPGAPLCRTLMLCGSMFGLGVIRHRYFEIGGFRAVQLPHQDHPEETITVAGNDFDFHEAQASMGIWHIRNKHTLAQCVPPAYSNYILSQFMYYGRDDNQITSYEDTKTHRLFFVRHGKIIYETSLAKGLEIVEFLKMSMPEMI
jgi:DNA (cytosine-5)-methyltransferase 1